MTDQNSPLKSYNPARNFIDIKKSFPNINEGVDYDSILASMNLYPVIYVDEGSYQGESLVLLKNFYGDYGILNFCWGSCSGCDWIANCDTYEDLDELRESFFHKIYWGKTLSELCLWWVNRDTDLYESVDKELNKKFVKLLRVYINIDDECEHKTKIRENLYTELLERIPSDDLRNILEHEDWYGQGVWELDDATLKQLVN